MAIIANQVRVLCDKEEKLVDILSEKDPAEIARNLYRKCIISDTMWNQYDCLDREGLEKPLQVRFLLRLVSKNLENDPAVWGKFLNLLSAMGSTFNTVSKNLQDLLNDYTSSDREPHIAADGEKSDVILTSADAEELSERLAEISYKWEELAIALKLPDGERGKIRNENKTSEICLNRVLVSWLSGNYVHSTNTLGALVKALHTSVVSKSKLGKEIEEAYRPVKRAKLSKDLTGQYPILTIINQSFNTTVADGKSTLLFVQASTRKNAFYEWQKDGLSIAAGCTYSGVDNDILVISHARQGTEGEYSCKVSSEGKNVCSNKIVLTVQYSPAKKQLLDLYSAASEVPQDFWPPSGTRTFINLALIESSKEPTATTDYSVKGSPDKIIKEMSEKKVEYESVFHKCISGRLVLIEGRPGCGKTTLVHKLIIDWSKGEVLVNARLAVLITLRDLNGRKAETLCEIFSCVCHNGEDIVQAISSDNGEGVCLIMDGLDEYQPQEKSSSCIYRLLNKTVLPKAIIIVSTRPAAVKDLKWDKLSIRMQVFGFTKQQIYEYIDCFPFTTMTYDSDHLSSASIPSAEPFRDNNTVPSNNSCESESLFSDSDNSSESESSSSDSDDSSESESFFFPSDSSLDSWIKVIDDEYSKSQGGSTANVSTTKLKKYLESNHHILDMCYLPVHLAMICFLFDSKNGHIPITRTKLYEEFTCCIILRYLRCSDSEAQLKSLQDMLKNTKKYFIDICLLAYKMTINSRQVVIPKEIGLDLSTGDLHDDMKYLGLVTTSHMATSNGFQNTCSFLHLTLQEFLAAYYISSLSITDQRREIKGHKSSVMSMVWTFYCGLVDFSDGIERLNDLLDGGSYNVKDFMHFALESQQPVVCDEVVKHAHGKFSAETPSDLLALDYVLSASSQAVSELELDFDAYETENAVRWLFYHQQSLGQLKVMKTPSFAGNIELTVLAILLKNCQKLETISTTILSREEESDELCLSRIIDALHSLRNLQELKLDFSYFDSQYIAQIFNGLQKLPNIKLHLFRYNDDNYVEEVGMKLPLLAKNELLTLDIGDSKIEGVAAAFALASGLRSISSLAELHLAGNNIGDNEASILSVGIQALSFLSVLNLSYNKIGECGARCLIGAIKLKKVTNLDLSHNCIQSATGIAAGFQYCNHLEVLNLSWNFNGSDSMRALAAEIKHCKNLKLLTLCNNYIDSHDMKAIAANIRHWKYLKVLNFTDNDIGCKGARALAAEFQHCESLECLSLSFNKIGLAGVKALSVKIQHCKNLEKLELSCNNINSDAAKALASNLKQHKNLKELDLSNNDIDSDDVIAIAAMIQQHCENLNDLKL